MKNRKLKSVLALLLVGVLFAAMTLTMGCGDKKTNAEVTASEQAYPASGATIGEGETQFGFTCVDAEGNEISYTINTNATVVADALLENNLVEGDDSEWGLYVKKVCGIVADYDVDQTYWAFYIDGEYAMTGVSATDIVPGSTYTFKVEK